MENEVIQTVLTEVLEELKELKQQNAKLVAVVENLDNKIDDFELKLSNVKVTAPATDLKPIISSINEGVLRLENIIARQPKNVTRQYRILLFPKNEAREYYKIVLGRLLFWMMVFLIATYSFVIGKELGQGFIKLKQTEAEAIQYKKAWIDLYKDSKKGLKKKMDSLWKREM